MLGRVFLGILLVVMWGPVDATVIGIDFGSSSYKVVLVQQNFNLVLNEQSARKTKNVISLRDGVRYFGSQAENVGRLSPPDSYNYLRDLLGKESPSSLGATLVSKYLFYADRLHPSTATFNNGSLTNYSFISVLVRDRLDKKVVEESDFPELGVHELVAMILSNAHKMAENAAGGNVVDTVLTVPSYFTQRERLALVDAASLGGLKILSLINEGTAFALKYAIDHLFVKSTDEDENKEDIILFYDHGEGSLQLTLAGFSRSKNKKNVTVPQVKVLATAWEIDLGAREFDRRLGEKFAGDVQEKYGVDLKKNPRAYNKLINELKKCREVLSANKEAAFVVEGLTSEIDYSGKLSRDSFEEMNADLFSLIPERINALLKSAEVEPSQLYRVEMVGGAVRIPKIQEIVKTALGREVLDFHINADEGAVFGAAFYAAGLSTQHHVKELKLKDITPWTVTVNVTKLGGDDEDTLQAEEAADEVVDEDESEESGGRMDKFASLFKKGNRYGSKKTLSFFASEPFQLELRYQEDEESVLPVGTDPLLEQYVIEGLPTQAKYNFSGKPKVHVQFQLTTSGIVELLKAEAEFSTTEYVKKKVLLEKTQEKEDEETASDSSNEAGHSEEEGEKTESEGGEGEGKGEDGESKEEGKKDESEEEEGEQKEVKDEVYEVEEVKKTQRIPLTVTSTQRGQIPTEVFKRSVKLLKEYNERDRIRFVTENARNDLEAYIFDTQEKLYDEVVVSMSTEEEREALSTALTGASDWLADTSPEEGKLEDYTSKKAELVEVGEKIFFRVRESTARMDALLNCMQTINFTRSSMENITKKLEVEESEVEELLKVAEGVEKWMEEKYKEQEALELWKDPILTSDGINTKCKDVTRLASKLLRRSKRKPPKVVKENTTVPDDTKTQPEEPPSSSSQPDTPEEDPQTTPPSPPPTVEEPNSSEGDVKNDL